MNNTIESLIISEEQRGQKKSLDDLLTTDQVAEQYKVYTSSSLRYSRSTNRSPFPFIKIGRKVIYKREDIENSLDSSKVSHAK